MKEKQPSLTALGAAQHRAAHQILERGAIFADPFALKVLGEEPEQLLSYYEENPGRRLLRLCIAARTRFAEDALASAIMRGTRNVFVLGAGFDTLALRNEHNNLGLRFFELDHPSTQLWKRNRLEELGLAIPECLSFVPIDFENQSLQDAIDRSGFDAGLGAFFVWLGVVPYLTRAAVEEVLKVIASLSDSEVVFDYTESIETYSEKHRAAAEELRVRVAAIGEPFRSDFEPEDIVNRLQQLRFSDVEDLSIGELIGRYLGGGPNSPNQNSRTGGGLHMIRARKIG